jgi:predicted TIM-barrel fold metal-dependent hydrolase
MVAASKNQAWLDQVHEEPLEPDLPICDPHHHLWDGVNGRVQPRYLMDEISADVAGGHNIISTVFIECGAMFRADGPTAFRPVGETEFVNGIAAMAASGQYGTTKIAAGIVGTVDLKRGDISADVLDAHVAAGGGRFRGIRLAASTDESDQVANHRTNPPKGLYLRDDFRQGFKHLGPRQMTFEAWCYHHQIPELTDLARSFPDITIVLDHFGGPLGVGPYASRKAEVFEEWKGHIDALARCPNVVAKLGGLNMDVNGFGWEDEDMPPSSEALMQATRHYFEYTIEAFGVERCMFESNFPVDKFSCSYTVLWNAFKRLTKDYSAAEKAALYHDTAARVYRL